MIVIGDSTILIGLAKIEKLGLLQEVFGKIYIPEEVFREVVERGSKKLGSEIVKEAEWIEWRSVTDKIQVNLLLASLDKGEAEVLGLAKEMKADLLLIDEEKARKGAVIAGFEVMGIVGLLLVAKNLGLIDKIKPHIEELKRKKFRIGDKIVMEGLKKAGEI
jgi:predicted nucleic acid-binding protein